MYLTTSQSDRHLNLIHSRDETALLYDQKSQQRDLKGQPYHTQAQGPFGPNIANITDLSLPSPTLASHRFRPIIDARRPPPGHEPRQHHQHPAGHRQQVCQRQHNAHAVISFCFGYLLQPWLGLDV
ncbi:hypothetical protein CVT26_010629 [Gymnopilus dilepis]|uniref:Uncharacterized protein n=1 Tax=Gymnopilus dilepis TaxID=231916 RepID=A0A409W551_9AGAR|nr:hypothetical protein CVT26_010629 [Gymnopilus dilepis]